MAKLNRTCTICHKKYSYCPTCAVDSNKPTWMAVFCCEGCKDLYNLINDYRYKLLSKEEAFYKLNGLDLSNVDKLPDNFKFMLNEILSVKGNSKEEVIEEVIEETIEETILDEPTVDVVNTDNVCETEQASKKIETDINVERIKKHKSKKKD